jgi:hypothetical protein
VAHQRRSALEAIAAEGFLLPGLSPAVLSPSCDAVATPEISFELGERQNR